MTVYTHDGVRMLCQALQVKSTACSWRANPRSRVTRYELIRLGQRIGCFIWPVRDSVAGSVSEYDFVLLADNYSTATSALRLVARAEKVLGAQSPLKRAAYCLAAEAISSLNHLLKRFDIRDAEVRAAHGWLRGMLSANEMFVERYMREDDPANPEDDAARRADLLNIACKLRQVGRQREGTSPRRDRRKAADDVGRETDRFGTLLEALEAASEASNGRLVVLDSARTSARRAPFGHADKAYELLNALATTYSDALLSGSGDAEARKVFGRNVFSAKESETVERNNRARRLRTFTYKDEQVEMMSHLKFGVKDSAVETLRIHFMWDALDQKIVIGHCGKHLDQR